LRSIIVELNGDRFCLSTSHLESMDTASTRKRTIKNH